VRLGFIRDQALIVIAMGREPKGNLTLVLSKPLNPNQFDACTIAQGGARTHNHDRPPEQAG